MPSGGRHQQYRMLFHEITGVITATLDLDAVLELIVRKVPEVLGVNAATIRLLNPAGDKLELVAAHGLSEGYLKRGPIDAEASVLEALQGTPVAVYDAASDARIAYPDAARREGIKSILVAPIRVRHRVQGVLRLLTRAARGYSEDEIRFVTALAEQCGIAIENARAFHRISELVGELERNKAFLRRIFDSLTAELFVLDRDLRVRLVNRSFLKNHRLREADILDRRCHEVLRVPEPAGGMAQVVREGRTTSYRFRMEEDGHSRWLEVVIIPANAGLRKRRHAEWVIGMIWDISVYVQLHEQHLERERLQGVLEMAGTVAHEISNPLGAAMEAARLIQRSSAPDNPEVQALIRNLNRMAGLMGKMSRITRYRSKPYIGGLRIVDLDNAVEPPGGKSCTD